MRKILIIVVLAALCVIPARGDGPPAHPTGVAIKKIKVIVRTGDDFGASTEEAVWFSLGPSYEWTLVQPDKPSFRNGAIDVFDLSPHGLRIEDIKYVKLRKSYGHDWLLQSIEVWIDGKPYYRNSEINMWLEGQKLEWIAPNFPPPVKTHPAASPAPAH